MTSFTTGKLCVWDMVFEGLTPEQVSDVRRALKSRTYNKGSTLFNLGDTANDLLVIRSGRIKCHFLGEAGAIYSPAIYGPGRVTGLLSALLSTPRMVSAVALEKTQIDSLSRNDLHSLVIDIPLFGENIAKLSAAMAGDLIGVLAERALQPAKERLFSALVALGQPPDPPTQDCALIVRGLSQEDLAGIVGTTRTWISLMLSDLEKDGLICRHKHAISIYAQATDEP